MFSTTELRPLLAERGIELSVSQVYRLVTENPERLSLPTLMAPLDILGCSMEQPIEPVSAPTQQRKAAGGSTAVVNEAGAGAFRPKRARVTK